MPAHPMSFADVLQDEYRYFFDEVPALRTSLKFERQHVRELDDFARKLLLARDQNAPTRWRFLGELAFPKKGPVAQDLGARVLRVLNEMLAPTEEFRAECRENFPDWRIPCLTLLDHLLKAEPDIALELSTERALHALLAIPVARGLLLQQPAMHAAIRRDQGVIPRFASQSAAIRILVAEGASEVLLRYPALFSTIADDPRVEKAVAADRNMRIALRQLFRRSPDQPWFTRWPGRTKKGAGDDLNTLAADGSKLLEMLGVSDETPPPDGIRAPQLSHFNALVLETVYGDYVSDGVTMRELYHAMHRKQTSALCLSGGGVRSATFNLGILQGLADHRMLNRFNYISTVSGGGYIGSWLSSWVRRHNEGAVGVAEDLVREPIDPLEPEVKPVRHLREYSSYLAPQSSAFSVDTWTLLATYVRNLLLNWTMLLPAMIAILTVPRLMAALLFRSATDLADDTGILATIAALFAVAMVGVVRPKSDITAKKKSVGDGLLRGAYNRYLLWLVPLLISGLLFTLYWASPHNLFAANAWMLPALFATGSVVSALLHVIRRAYACVGGGSWWHQTKAALVTLFTWKQQGRRLARECRAAVLAGFLAGVLLYALFTALFPWDRMMESLRFEAYLCIGIPLYLLVFFIEATLLIGFTTQTSSDHDREWWARSAATVFLAGTCIGMLCFVVAVLPILILLLPKFLAPIGGLSGGLSWLLQKKVKTKSKGDSTAMPMMTVLHIAAAIFMAFILALLSIGTSYALAMVWPVLTIVPGPDSVFGTVTNEATAAFISVLRYSPAAIVAFCVVAATAIALIMSTVLDVNLYSMHAMYRNRLVRAYLGASRWRRNPDAFTGFDPQDDVRMADLRPEALWPSTIVNFDALLHGLRAAERLRGQLPGDVQERVLAYDPVAKNDDRESLKAAVVTAINAIMSTRDLQHDIPASPSLNLFLANRTYLETKLGDAIKEFREEVHLAPFPTPFVRLDRESTPTKIRRDLNVRITRPVRGRPPLHIVNAALNLVGGKNLAWQERKAASFTISPLHSGSRLLCYRDSAVYAGGLTLGTALAISGAAVSPNMGSLSSPTFTFLMTLFNARLGWWLGNPAKDKYDRCTPVSSITSLLREAGGKTDESHPFVFLSDGGHFENLGVYEMVARRCKYIMVCDASADGSYAFGDLANAVRKIRIDMGIPIEPLTTEYIAPDAGEKHGKYCAMGEIQYRNVDGGDAIGYLLYIKPAVRGDCPADVRNYRKESEAFPHESTVDQFFSESQFESYRALGRHILGEICDSGVHKNNWVTPNVAAFFGKAWAYIHKVKPGIGDRPVTSMNDVVGWMRDGL